MDEKEFERQLAELEAGFGSDSEEEKQFPEDNISGERELQYEGEDETEGSTYEETGDVEKEYLTPGMLWAALKESIDRELSMLEARQEEIRAAEESLKVKEGHLEMRFSRLAGMESRFKQRMDAANAAEQDQKKQIADLTDANRKLTEDKTKLMKQLAGRK